MLARAEYFQPETHYCFVKGLGNNLKQGKHLLKKETHNNKNDS